MDKIFNGGNQVCVESNNVSANGTSVQNPKTENGKIQIPIHELIIKGIQSNKPEYVDFFIADFFVLCYIHNISRSISVINLILNDIRNNKLKEYYDVKNIDGFEIRLFIKIRK